VEAYGAPEEARGSPWMAQRTSSQRAARAGRTAGVNRRRCVR
jgi:hypothetical protein